VEAAGGAAGEEIEPEGVEGVEEGGVEPAGVVDSEGAVGAEEGDIAEGGDGLGGIAVFEDGYGIEDVDIGELSGGEEAGADEQAVAFVAGAGEDSGEREDSGAQKSYPGA
jgi:hypothetical protein